MTRFNAMYNIINFGVFEQKQLLSAGKYHEAHQIEYARNNLILFLNENPVKNIRKRLEEMTCYTVKENGKWEYHPMRFVHDEFTRLLLEDLKEKFA